MAAGAFILAISAIFATKANKKFLYTLTTLSMSGSTSAATVIWNSAAIFTTSFTAGSGLVPFYIQISTKSTTVGGQEKSGQALDKSNSHPAYVLPANL